MHLTTVWFECTMHNLHESVIIITIIIVIMRCSLFSHITIYTYVYLHFLLQLLVCPQLTCARPRITPCPYRHSSLLLLPSNYVHYWSQYLVIFTHLATSDPRFLYCPFFTHTTSLHHILILLIHVWHIEDFNPGLQRRGAM